MKNNLKKVIIVLSILFFAIIFIVRCSPLKYVKTSGIKEYVDNNSEYLTQIADQLLDAEDDDNFPTQYRNKSEIPDNIDVNKLYKDLWVYYIHVSKYAKDTEDYVHIQLKNKNGNYICAIYYSPSGKLLDYGRPKEGDTYEIEEYRHKFRTEKICDNWYYSEDYRW